MLRVDRRSNPSVRDAVRFLNSNSQVVHTVKPTVGSVESTLAHNARSGAATVTRLATQTAASIGGTSCRVRPGSAAVGPIRRAPQVAPNVQMSEPACVVPRPTTSMPFGRAPGPAHPRRRSVVSFGGGRQRRRVAIAEDQRASHRVSTRPCGLAVRSITLVWGHDSCQPGEVLGDRSDRRLVRGVTVLTVLLVAVEAADRPLPSSSSRSTLPTANWPGWLTGRSCVGRCAPIREPRLEWCSCPENTDCRHVSTYLYESKPGKPTHQLDLSSRRRVTPTTAAAWPTLTQVAELR